MTDKKIENSSNLDTPFQLEVIAETTKTLMQFKTPMRPSVKFEYNEQKMSIDGNNIITCGNVKFALESCSVGLFTVANTALSNAIVSRSQSKIRKAKKKQNLKRKEVWLIDNEHRAEAIEELNNYAKKLNAKYS